MAAVGALAGDPSADFAIGISTAFQKSMWFANFSANTVPAFDRREVAAELLAAASRGEVESVVHEVLPLERSWLTKKMEVGEVFGKIVRPLEGRVAARDRI